MIEDVDFQYRQHLTEADQRLLATVAGTGLESALAHPDLEAVLFFEAEPDDRFLPTSPFLTFAVAIHRTAARLQSTTYVEERWAPRRRVPVFDVEPLRQVLAGPARRLLLIELLASYTHVTSGVSWQRTRRGWRRRRFSELDPVRLAELVEAVSPAERPGVYRRLGDLALFLTGVFPDHPTVLDMGPVAVERLLRLSGLRGRIDPDTVGPDLLARLGRHWYRQAVRSAQGHGAPVTGGLAAVAEVAESFDHARRVLNVVTDWYLFPLRQRWFGLGEGS
ncbi:MAG TPA: hypothetical protein VE990_18040 [Acidimicrobiales bacterium]|nr:hypothetical protein [Acidimicrobiales bacterium]